MVEETALREASDNAASSGNATSSGESAPSDKAASSNRAAPSGKPASPDKSASARKPPMALALAAVIGFGLLQGARFFDPSSGPYSHHAFALLGLAIDGLTFLVVALLSYFAKLERPEPLFWIGAAAAAVHVTLGLCSFDSPMLYIVMQIASGIGWSLNVLCWMFVFVCYRPQMALPMITLGYAVDVAIQPLGGVFPHATAWVLLAVYAGSIALLHICLKGSGRVVAVSKEIAQPRTTLAEAYSRTRRAVAATFTLSAVCGFVLESDYLSSGLEYAQTGLTSLICLGCALAMTAVLLAFKVKKADIDYVCPLAAACVAAAVAMRGMSAGGDYVAGSIMTATLVSFYVFLWLMFISEARERMLPAFFLLGLALAVARLSVAGGRLLAQLVHVRFELDAAPVSILALWALATVVCLVFICSLRSRSKYAKELVASFLPEGSTNEVQGGSGDSAAERDSTAPRADAIMHSDSVRRGSSSLTDTPDATSSAVLGERDAGSSVLSDATGLMQGFDASFDALAETYGLSVREAEVLKEFAVGRSAHYIAEWYMLSEHTVKTHIRRAYAKMDVHSRQELLDRVEEMEAKRLGERESASA